MPPATRSKTAADRAAARATDTPNENKFKKEDGEVKVSSSSAEKKQSKKAAARQKGRDHDSGGGIGPYHKRQTVPRKQYAIGKGPYNKSQTNKAPLTEEELRKVAARQAKLEALCANDDELV